MSIVGTADMRGKRILGTFILITFLVATTGMPILAQESATIYGLVAGPDGELGGGFTVHLKDVGTGKIIASGPTDAVGQYSAQVPVGGRYVIDHVTAPDGSVLSVRSIAPIPIAYAGSTRLDVKFQKSLVAPEPEPQVKTKPVKTKPVETKKVKAPKAPKPTKPSTGSKPWYKRKGGIIGIVLVSGGAIAAATGGDSKSVSPPSN